MKTPKISLFWNKNVESFHEYCPYAFSPAVSVKFVLEQKVQSSTWKMSNVAIFHILVALNISFYSVKNSRDTIITDNSNFKEFGPS